MASVNKVILVGNLGKDPEIRHTQTGKSVVQFSIATTEKWNDANGNAKEQTEWHRIVVWGKTAENCAKFLKKGSSVFIEGRLTTRSWEDQGQKRYSTEVVADRVQFLSSGSRAPDPEYPGAPVYDSSFSTSDIPF